MEKAEEWRQGEDTERPRLPRHSTGKSSMKAARAHTLAHWLHERAGVEMARGYLGTVGF